MSVDSRNNRHQFAVSTDGKRFETIGEAFTMRMGAWKGTRVGLFCYATKGEGGRARFDFFHYDMLR